MASNNKKKNNAPTPGLPVERLYTTPGQHPYDTVTWTKRDVVQTNWKTGDVVFEQKNVEFPESWSENAATIVTTKYFRGAEGSDTRENSLKQLVDRVVQRYTDAAWENGYITDRDALEVFDHELKYMLIHQVFSFNSPVWFNVGTTSPQQVSACFILSVDDTMDSILNWYREEGMIFKGGSGAGLNISRIRSSQELLKSSGGTASGPVSFMRGADASAGTIKSGGATRRAAKMVVLDVDHPDIEEFVATKAREENKIRALRDAGFDMDLGGEDITSVQYQNANNSVRVSDEFMTAVANDSDFGLRARTTGDVISTVNAKNLFRQIAEAAWACADPGIQYDDTINRWHTNPTTGRINASNPCSEYMSLDNSSCNLASLNLMKFRAEDGTFNADLFTRAVEFVITAMEISISFADFPTTAIAKTTRDFRQLGIGYANLGALLMASGYGYDSPKGRALAGSITSLMTGVAYRRSAEIAGIVGPYKGYKRNKAGHIAVMEQHARAADTLVNTLSGGDAQFVADDIVAATPLALPVAEAAAHEWATGLTIGADNGWRNAQASVLAPTGTIGFMMDVDTTGVEPDFALTKFKKLVGGGSLQIVNQRVHDALTTLGYSTSAIEKIEAYILENGHVVDAPDLDEAHYPVFDCAVGTQRYIAPAGHTRMMAAVQPFISGAISKTVNLPETATVEDIERIYYEGWELGLKALAVYRDNCKTGQPLSSSKDTKDDTPADAPVERVVETVIERPVRRRLPKTRTASTVSFAVAGAEGYLTTGSYDDGDLGEVFIKMSKQGSTLAGIMDAFSIAVSLGLQHGVPLEAFVRKFTNMRFEPAGMTDDPDIRMAQSLLDYMFRRLALNHMSFDERSEFGIYTSAERAAAVENGGEYLPLDADVDQGAVAPKPAADPQIDSAHEAAAAADNTHSNTKGGFVLDAPLCLTCGTKMRPSGACFACDSCGHTSGCS
jgi:ribonucleoside-diphosphate reductase alpha chain